MLTEAEVSVQYRLHVSKEPAVIHQIDVASSPVLNEVRVPDLVPSEITRFDAVLLDLLVFFLLKFRVVCNQFRSLLKLVVGQIGQYCWDCVELSSVVLLLTCWFSLTLQLMLLFAIDCVSYNQILLVQFIDNGNFNWASG